MTTNQGISGGGSDLLIAARRRWGVPALALTLLVIFGSLTLMVGYFVVLPRRIARRDRAAA